MLHQKKVLVTGACGYIGRHVVEELLSRGYAVIASDVAAAEFPAGVSFTDYPIFSEDADLYKRLGSPDALIHLAWRQGFVHNADAHMEDLSRHVRFLNRMIGAGIWSISVMGSMHEIGYWEGAVKDDTPCNPQSQYGVAKNALRQSMLLYAQGKPTNFHWLRAYYIYGDDRRGSSIFAKLRQAADEGKTSFPFTSGKNKYDFLPIDELARQIVAATMQDKINGVINICSGKPKELAEQVEWYIRENGLQIRLDYGAYPDRPYDSPAIWGDNTKIQQILEAECN